MSCRGASMIAIAFVFAMQADAQQASAPVATHWEHTLIRQECFEALDQGTGHSAWFTAEWPLTLKTQYMTLFQPGDFPTRGEDDHSEDGIARYESREFDIPSGFHDALVSWNSDCPKGAGVSVELRVGRKTDKSWSPWLNVATWGDVEVPNPRTNEHDDVVFDAPAITSFGGGKIDDDYFISEQLWDRIQYRVRARCDAATKNAEVHVRRVVLCLSRRVDGAAPSSPVPHEHARIAVPFRSQMTERPEIAWKKISLPTSVAMVMALRGVDKSTSEVAERLLDQERDTYRNWPRAAQGAYTFGVPGYLARFSNWSEVESLIAAGQPLVIKLADKSASRALVLCGFDTQGQPLVDDPSASNASKGQFTMRRDQLDDAWLAHGGTALVLLAKEK